MFSARPPRWVISTIKTLILSMVVPLISALPVFVPHVAQAAIVGSGLCQQTAGTNDAANVTTTQIGNDCLVTFVTSGNATLTTNWKAPDYLSNVRYLVVGGGGSGDRGVCNSYYGKGGGGGQVLDSTRTVSGGTTYTVVVGKGGDAVTTGCGNGPGNNGADSSFDVITAKAGLGALQTSAAGGTSGTGKSGGTGTGGSPNYTGGGGGGAATDGTGINGGAGVFSNITNNNLMYGSGGAGRDVSIFGTSYNTDGTQTTSVGTQAVIAPNSGNGGTDLSANTGSTTGAGGIVVIRYQAVFTSTFNSNSPISGSPSQTSATTNLGSTFTFPSVGSMSKPGYVLAGWSTSANGTGAIYSAGATFYPSSDVTYYAVWQSTVYYETNTATSTRAIESTTALTANAATTLSNGKLVPGTPISNGLVFNMNAADSSSVVGSTWYDAARNGTTASLVNAPSYNAKEGYFTVNGSTQYINIGGGHTIGSGTTSYTASVMFKADKPNVDDGSIMSRYYAAGGNGQWIIRQRTNSVLQYWRGAYGDLSAPSAFNEGDINYATITYNGTTMKLYLNGALVSSVATSASAATTTTDLILGSRGYNGSMDAYWAGRIYSAQGYSRALSETEVAMNYQAMIPNQIAAKTGYTLVGYNTAVDGTGTSYGSTVADLAALPSPYLRLLPSEFNASTKVWSPSIGSGAGFTYTGTPAVNLSGGKSWGATATFPTVSGTTTAGIRLNNPTLNAYTFCAVVRYKDVSGAAGTQRRIIASSSGTYDWISGFHAGLVNRFHNNGWTYSAGYNDMNWHYYCHSANRAFWDGTKDSPWTYQAFTALPEVSINWGVIGGTETSDWELAEIIIYDQYLPDSQIEQVNRYFKNTYGILGGSTTTAAAAVAVTTNYASPGNNPIIYAQWGSTITYEGNKQTTGSVPAPTLIKGTGSALAANTGSLARAGYRFDGWNTAADGSGTNYAAGGTYPNTGNITLYAKWTIPTIFPTNVGYVDPASLRPYMRFRAADYDTSTRTWYDSSGNGRSTSIIQGSLTSSTVGSNANGSNKSFQVVAGTTTTKINFNNPQLTNYTLFNVARYVGTNRQRIVQSNDHIQIFGFHGGTSGVSYHNGWVSQYSTDVFSNNWVLSSDYAFNYRANGANLTVNANTGDSYLRPIGVNWDGTQVSDFQIAEVLIFDRTLTIAEIQLVEDYLANSYGLTNVTQSKSYPNPRTYYVGAGAGGGLRTETFTATQGLGTKTFTMSPTFNGITLDNSTVNGTAVVISTLAAIGTYLETITATDQSGATTTFQVNLVVTPYTKFDTRTATTLTTSYGVSKTLRLDTVQGIGTKVFSILTNPLNHFTIDTSTAGSGYATLGTTGFVKPGTYSVVVAVTDSTTVRSTYTISVTVNQTPLITYPNGIVPTFRTNNLVIHYDVTNPLSYSGSETRVADLVGTNNAVITTSTPYSANYRGHLDIAGGNYLAMNTCIASIATSSMSYFLWVNPRGTGVVVLEKDGGWLASTIDVLNGVMQFRVYSGTKITYTLPSMNKWYYVGITYDGTTARAYVNGTQVGAQVTTRSVSNVNGKNCLNIGPDIAGAANMGTTAAGNFLFGALHVYTAPLTDTDVAYNYEVTQKNYLVSPATSGKYTINTTAGFAANYSLFSASLGTGNKTFSLSPKVTGVTLDTSTANTAILKLGTGIAANGTSAATYLETMTATDSVTGLTKYDLSITVNPAISITASTPTTLSTTFGKVAYDTFTATYGTGTKTFSIVSSAYGSAFTLTPGAANSTLLTVSASLPAGTYTETITALDSVGATANYVLTVIVNAAPSIAGNPSNTVTTTVTKPTTLRIDVLNGTGTRRIGFTSPIAGITLDTSTLTANYMTLRVESTTPVNTFTFNISVTDSVNASATGSFTVVINRWPVIGTPSGIVTSNLKVSLSSDTYSGSGAWLDTSGNGKNAALGASATPAKTSPSYTTNSGGVFSLNETTSATTNYMQIASPGSFETFTVSVWARFSSIPTSGEPCLIADYWPSSGKMNYVIGFQSGKIYGRWYANPSWSTNSVAITPVINTWYNITYSVYKSGSNYYSDMFLNGVRAGAAVSAGTTAPASSDRPVNIGKRWDLDEYINGQIGGVLIYNRALSDAEIMQNFNAQGARFLATNSGTTNYATTEGINSSLTAQVATGGTSTKTFVLAPTVPGITIDTSTANSYVLNIASTVGATDTNTARTIYETVTATDSMSAVTNLAYRFTINPPIKLSATALSLTTTSGIVAWDTFTSTLGTGNKTFTLTGSPSTTGFTLTQANNAAVLKVEPTANPGTYYETITARDEVGATKSVSITVVIRPKPTILGPNTLVAAKGIAYRSPALTVINGSSPFRYSLASKALAPDTNTVTGITWDTATMTLNLSTSVGSGTYVETLTVIDSYSATSSFVISLTVKDPISITGGALDITKTYGVNYQQTYNVNNLTSAVGFRTSVGGTSDVCVPITGIVDSSTYEMLTSIGTCNWIAPAGITSADYVVAAGGGAGGISRSGGGGGGGVAMGSAMPITASATYGITVGAGGAAVSSGRGSNGGNSAITNGAASTTYVSAGGGGGGGTMNTDTNISYGATGNAAPSATIKSAGGNGGGGAPNFSNPALQYTVGGDAGAGTVTGFKGGNSFRCDSNADKNDGNLSGSGRTSGGGGGAGGVGIGYTTGATCPTYDGNAKPNGGSAVSTSITGTAIYLGAGGGGSDGRAGGGAEYLYGSTGRGVGTNGGGSGEQADVPAQGMNPTVITAASGSAGAENSGGGGGGGIYTSFAGGSGLVILKYLTPARVTNSVSLTALSNGSSTTSAQVLLSIPENVQAGQSSKVINIINGSGTQTASYTVNITINKAIPDVTVVLPGNVTTGKYGNEITLYASVSTDGNVEFKDNGTVITGCGSVASVAGIATCQWTPTTVATRSISAKLSPTDTTNYDSSTVTSSIVVSKADTLTVTASDETVLYNNGSAITLSKPFSYSGLVSIDTLTAVGMIYTGTANDLTSVDTKVGPTVAGTYLITPDTSVAQLSSILGNYVGYNLVTGTLTVNRIAPTLSLVYATTNTVVYSPNLTVDTSTATRSGTGEKTFSSSSLDYCTVDSSTARVSVIKAGSCLITMDVAQSPNFLSASIVDTLTVTKATRTISLTAPVSSLKYTETTTVTVSISGGVLDGQITFSLNNNPGCDIDGLSYELLATSGTLACTVNANISTGDNYESATTTSPLALTIAKADAPVISISSISALDYTPGVRAPITPVYTVTGFKGTDEADYLNLIYGFVSNPFETFAYSETQTPIDAGTYSLTPTSIVMKSGLISNYETPTFSASAVNFTINRIAQETITITNVNAEISVPYFLNISGGNNPTGSVTYNKVSGNCSLSTNRLDASQPGLCVVTVTLSGNRNYLSATSDSITVMIRNYTVYEVFNPGNTQTGILLPHVTALESGTVVAPNITLASPDSGRSGDVIVLTGTHFTGATRVIFNVFTDAITFSVDDDNTITVEIPAGVEPTALDGIDVVTPGGPSARFYDFTILP